MQPDTDPIHIFKRTLNLIERHIEREHDEPVAPFLPPDALAEHIDTTIPSAGATTDDVFQRLDQILAATPRTTTRSFFNQLFAGRDPVAQAGEILASVLNSSMYTYKAAGPHALIERSLTAHMASKLGLHQGEGVFCPGGSLANFCGMLMARDAKLPRARDEGIAANGADRLTMYTSDLSHYSIPKNANMMGIGRDRCRRVPTDERGRIIPAELSSAIRDDLDNGFTPFMVNATAGTTVLGAFDPIDPIADVCERFDLWLHLDGCLGCSAILSTDNKHLLQGSHRAHSVTWNAHKMMGVPLPCSVVLTRDIGPLHTTFNQTATYLFQSDEDFYNLGTMSIQCGRRNDALKLFAAWLHHGDTGYDKRITHLFDLTRHAADLARDHPDITLSKQPESVTCCFEVTGKSSEAICQTLRERGDAVVGFAIVDGRKVIRLACVNAENTTADIDDFFNRTLDAARDLPPADNAVSHEQAGATA